MNKKLVKELSGPVVILLALKWIPVQEVYPNSPFAGSGENDRYWVPPYNTAICFKEDEAIKTAFHTNNWVDMANGRFDSLPRSKRGIKDDEVDWGD
jgi:hypothetical protein